jgi:hypothetical protein
LKVAETTTSGSTQWEKQMNKKQQDALVMLGVGVAAAVALDKLNARNAAILGIPALGVAILVALVARGLE